LLSSIWAISTPIGSAADDGYHLTSIWCAWGVHETCQEKETGLIKLVPEKIVGHPPCFVTWPWADQSGVCIKSVSEDLVEATYFNTGTYPPLFYFVMRFFVGPDSEQSVIIMRVFNSLLASLMLFAAVKVSPFFIQRALLISWGAGIVPIGIFFIPSTNPSSWTIIGVATFWAFFYSSLYFQKWRNRRKSIISGLGAIFAFLIATGSRYDSGVYIMLSFLAILIIFFRRSFIKTNFKYVLSLVLLAIPVVYFFVTINLRRFGFSIVIPSSGQNSQEQPNAIVNLLIELPSFLLGVFGGQYPDRTQTSGELGVNFKYGVGWLEFNFLSITGILISLSVFSLFFIGLRFADYNKVVAIIFLFASTVTIMIFIRGLDGFANNTYFQPRYFLPILLVILGISLIEDQSRSPILNFIQASLLVLMVFIGGVISWLTVFTRYAISPLAPITNLDQSINWWPAFEFLKIEKFNYFIMIFLVNIIWNFSTIWIWSTRKPSRLMPVLPNN
jgi:hypothetical protein